MAILHLSDSSSTASRDCRTRPSIVSILLMLTPKKVLTRKWLEIFASLLLKVYRLFAFQKTCHFATSPTGRADESQRSKHDESKKEEASSNRHIQWRPIHDYRLASRLLVE